MSPPDRSVAETLLLQLGRRGVPFLFANAGTDAAPLIEAFARLQAEGTGPVPRPVVVAHEMAAVSMAHGYAMVSGTPAAVFLHVTVGTANAAAGIMNASRQRVPMLVMAGRTPVLEAPGLGTRDMYIHWAQESFDQAAMIREYVRWDYELRHPGQVDAVVDRALGVAMSEPQGPVYLTLPRELVSGPAAPSSPVPARADTSGGMRADEDALRRAADLIMRAERPLVITNSLGRDVDAVPALVEFAETAGAGVVEVFRERMSFPSSHPHHLGFGSARPLQQADLVVVAEADVPWFPDQAPPASVPVVNVSCDPLRKDYPMWGFPVDVALGGRPAATLRALTAMLGKRTDSAGRTDKLGREHRAILDVAEGRAMRESSEAPIGAAFLSRCIGDVAGPDAIVVNEYDVHSDQLRLDRPGSFFGASSVSGLGWGVGAAIGVKLAEPDRPVVCTVGDGAYIFSNPVACHMAAQQLGVGLVVVVFNNGRWDAVRTAVRRLAPDGWAVRSDNFPLTDLSPSPRYADVAIAAGALGEEVDDPGRLVGALERAMELAGAGRQVVLDVHVG